MARVSRFSRPGDAIIECGPNRSTRQNYLYAACLGPGMPAWAKRRNRGAGGSVRAYAHQETETARVQAWSVLELKFREPTTFRSHASHSPRSRKARDLGHPQLRDSRQMKNPRHWAGDMGYVRFLPEMLPSGRL